MVTTRDEGQTIGVDTGSIPTILSKVDSAFHSLGGIGKWANRTDGCLAWLPYSYIQLL